MRIIAGSARGIRLAALDGKDTTRPTVDRVKEAVFSMLHFMVPGALVLDLYSGSGQMGIEALSRGAEKCVFIDDSTAATNIISSNLRAAGLFSSAIVATTSAGAFLAGTRDNFDIVLLDPPYNKEILQDILPKVANTVKAGGTVICESEVNIELPQSIGGLVLQKQYKYGKVLITRYEKE